MSEQPDLWLDRIKAMADHFFNHNLKRFGRWFAQLNPLIQGLLILASVPATVALIIPALLTISFLLLAFFAIMARDAIVQHGYDK